MRFIQVAGILATLLAMISPSAARTSAAAEPDRPVTITGKGGAPSSQEKAASEIGALVTAAYRDVSGSVDYPSVFNALGALAGFGCQMSIREGFIKPGLIAEDKAFVVVKTKDGGAWFFGDLLNGGLFGAGTGQQISVWSLVAGAAKQAGASRLPGINELARHAAEMLGTPEYGIPAMSARYKFQQLPMEVLRGRWEGMQTLLTTDGVDPRYWGWTFALAAQQLILSRAGGFDPTSAAEIVMEAAVPMSKVDPAAVLAKPR